MKKLALISSLLMLAACAKEMGANTYKSGDTVGKVVRGVIIHAEAVTIRDNDAAKQNGAGILGGGIAGGVAGSTVGQGDGKPLATAGAAIAGAVIGALIEEELSTHRGFQYVIEINAPSPENSGTWRTQKNEIRRGNASNEDDIKRSIQTRETQSDMISVIQTDDVPLAAGQPVLVIYHDDRPRVVADKSRR
jgi:outer membrane lipoprotein SlyB